MSIQDKPVMMIMQYKARRRRHSQGIRVWSGRVLGRIAAHEAFGFRISRADFDIVRPFSVKFIFSRVGLGLQS